MDPIIHIVFQNPKDYDTRLLGKLFKSAGFVACDPSHDRENFIVCGSEKVAREISEELKQGIRNFGGQVYVSVGPYAITVDSQYGKPATISRTGELLRPILEQFRFKVHTEMGDDISDQFESDPKRLFDALLG